MRSLPVLWSRGARALLPWCAVVAAACVDPVDPGPVRRIEITVPTPTLRPGASVLLAAQAFDATGAPVEATFQWQSLTPSVATASATGLVTAMAPGVAVIRATAGSVSQDAVLALTNPPVAQLLLPEDTLVLVLGSAPTTLPLAIVDSLGVPIVGELVLWESSAARRASVSPSGVVTPLAVGAATIHVRVKGALDSVMVRVTAPASPTAPAIDSVVPALVTPGSTVTVYGQRFGATPGTNTVLVDGVPMTVTTATTTHLVLNLPAAPCLPTQAVALQVTTAGGVGVAPVMLRTAPQRALGVGEALILTTANEALCNELLLDGGEYLVTVSHVARALGAGPAPLSVIGAVGEGAAQGSAHSAILAASRAQAMHAPAALRAEASRGAPEAALQIPDLGGITPLRVPDVNSPNFCRDFRSIGARAVFVGAHVAILEDTLSTRGGTPTLAGTMDSALVAIGQEVEATLWPIVTRFGDPLAMDGALDANGRVAIVVTPTMNEMRGGSLMGLTVTCDFYPRATFASSNVGEVLYLQVPTSSASGVALGTVERWRHDVRGVIVHELKHIVSYAERITRGWPLEELWLDEAMARVAEELYARAFYSLAPTADAGFAASVRCELIELPTAPGCDDTPRLMRSHLDGLWDFLDRPAARSPLGAVEPGDVSYYGSAWSLVRWAMDQSPVAEDLLLHDLTVTSQTGVNNLEARVGLPWAVMLPLWSLALLTDGTDAAITSAQLTFPAWNLADLYAGLCGAFNTCAGGPAGARYTRPHPAQPPLHVAGPFTVSPEGVAPGGFIAVRVTGGTADLQLLEVRGGPGTSPANPPNVRLAILRTH